MTQSEIFKVPLTAREVYRVNRIRLAKEFSISPHDVDTWNLTTYYDALEVLAGESFNQSVANA